MLCGYGPLDGIHVVVVGFVQHMWVAFSRIRALLVDAIEKGTDQSKLPMWIYALLLLHEDGVDEELSQVLLLIML